LLYCLFHAHVALLQTLALRKEAEALLEARQKERGVKKDKATAGKAKKTRKEKADEQQAELNEIIKELAEKIEITGPGRYYALQLTQLHVLFCLSYCCMLRA
jgi:predicted  nucleic acid-binding Zn-ribbon protein